MSSISLHDVYIVGLIVAMLAAVATLFLKEIPLRGGEQDAQTSAAAA